MTRSILTVEIRYEHDVVLARQRSRQIASLLGFGHQEQTRIGTAVSEIARNAFQYAGGGKVDFRVEGDSPQSLVITISDQGKGIARLDDILNGRYSSPTGMGVGIVGARRLMDGFEIKSQAGSGTTVVMRKYFPARSGVLTPVSLARIADELARRRPETPFEEIQQQNRELLRLLEELRARQSDLERLNRELEDTNRGVVALYAELDDKAYSLQRASDLKTRFLSNMSHEFRTPLNAILSLSRLLLNRSDGDLTPEQEKQVSYIRQSAQDLSELVNDLLDLAKVEAGKVVVRPREFEVGDLFSALRGMLRPLLVSNNVELVFEPTNGIPTLYTDESKVSQVLRNFISNALKFTERGEIRVSATMGHDNRVIFSVADTGIGIAAADQARIFEEWTQVESHLQRKVKGTGLGLPLSKKLTELLGGTIWVKSEVGVGSTFYAEFPTVYKGAEEVGESTPHPQVDPTRVPVLAIEDNRETLDLYHNYLRNSRFQLITASRLTDARRLVREIQPAAILLDILLHDESTWTFLTEMKSSHTTRSIPVIVATVVDNRTKAEALGADEFVVKPVERDWLLATLNRYVQRDERARVLLIDDDEVSRYVMREVLGRTRYAVTEASSAREGMLRARQMRPQAIFLDLNMPEMNGFDALDEVKRDPATRDIPVIVITSKLLTEEERKRLEANAVAVMSKEFSSRDEAVAIIDAALLKAGVTAVQTVSA